MLGIVHRGLALYIMFRHFRSGGEVLYDVAFDSRANTLLLLSEPATEEQETSVSFAHDSVIWRDGCRGTACSRRTTH